MTMIWLSNQSKSAAGHRTSSWPGDTADRLEKHGRTASRIHAKPCGGGMCPYDDSVRNLGCILGGEREERREKKEERNPYIRESFAPHSRHVNSFGRSCDFMCRVKCSFRRYAREQPACVQENCIFERWKNGLEGGGIDHTVWPQGSWLGRT